MSKRRPHSTPVLFVYVTTMLICLVIFGSAAVVLLDVFVTQPREELERQEQISNAPVEEISNDYSNSRETILFVGAEGETLNGIVLLRVLPDNAQIKLIPIPSSTVAVVGNSTETIKTHFENGGITYLKTAVEDTFKVKCDKYIKISNDGFDRLVEFLGGTSSYVFPQDLFYKDAETGETTNFTHGQASRTLWGDDIRKIVNYPYYDSNETQTRVLGELSASLLNSAAGAYKKSIISNMQNIFNTIFNNSDTDITSKSFKQHREAYEYMVNEASGSSVVYRMPSGSFDEDGYFRVSETVEAETNQFFEIEN